MMTFFSFGLLIVGGHISGSVTLQTPVTFIGHKNILQWQERCPGVPVLFFAFDVLYGEMDLLALLWDDSWRPLAELTAGLYRLPWDMQYILLCFRFGVCNSVTVFCLLSEDPGSMEHNWHMLKSEGQITESYFTLSGNWRHGVSQAENGFNDPMVLGRRGGGGRAEGLQPESEERLIPWTPLALLHLWLMQVPASRSHEFKEYKSAPVTVPNGFNT